MICSKQQTFCSLICKYLHYLRSKECYIWCLAVVFLKASIGAEFIHISSTVWELQPLYKPLENTAGLYLEG